MKHSLLNLPNALTCGNLLCGSLGILEIFHGNILLSCGLLFTAAILDFFDGFVARLLNISSPIGKQLDSLADCVTFGLLPAMILYALIQDALPDLNSLWKAYFALSIALFSALRLAKFNVDTRQSDSFIGVPTPANGMLVASLPLIIRFQPEYQPLIMNANLLLGYVFVMSYLLIAELPLFALKFKSFGWQGNEIKYIFVGLSLVLLIFMKFAAMPLIIALYILLSVAQLVKKIA